MLVVAGAGSGKTRTLVYPRRPPGRERRRPAASCCSPSPARRPRRCCAAPAGLLDGRCEQVGRRHLPLLRQHRCCAATASALGLASRLHHPRPRRQRGRDRPAAGPARARQEGAALPAQTDHRRDASAWRSTKAPAVAELVDERVRRTSLEHCEDLLRALRRLHRATRHEQAAARLRRSAGEAARRCSRRMPSSPAQLAQQYRYHHGRRVPGHQRRCRPRSSACSRRRTATSWRSATTRRASTRFRGADFRNIMRVPRLFPGTRVITLEAELPQHARRSSTSPTRSSSAAREQLHQEPVHRAAGRRARRCWSLPSTRTSSRASSASASSSCARRACRCTDIAVLFRSSFHSFDLELELAARDIPFVKRGGFRFIETAHVKDVLAHLRVIANPRDAVSWNRILLLLDGVGPQEERRDRWRLLGGPSTWGGSRRRLRAAYSRRSCARLAALLGAIGASQPTPASR